MRRGKRERRKVAGMGKLVIIGWLDGSRDTTIRRENSPNETGWKQVERKEIFNLN